MADANEIRALKASFLGALDTGAALEAVKSKILALDADGDIAAEDLEELGRLTLAHAVSSQSLRGFIESMRGRRGGG